MLNLIKLNLNLNQHATVGKDQCTTTMPNCHLGGV